MNCLTLTVFETVMSSAMGSLKNKIQFEFRFYIMSLRILLPNLSLICLSTLSSLSSKLSPCTHCIPLRVSCIILL